ncbi:MAG: hypothetical protein CVU89_15800 [Firmicutes bacterium HGW-Firmicutes-14]|nr:MAG: hypothetical protein CVU89_15800 [Firmicutes bacterium HGW-Firmicutes-14]
MKCANHPEEESVRTCGLCGGDFCEKCLIELEDRSFCRKCLTEKISEPVQSAPKGGSKTDRKSRFWAFVMSLIPGVGYMYLGLMNRGLQTMVLFFGSIFVTSFIGFEELMALIAPVVVFYSIFDTQQLVKSINEGGQVEDKLFFDIRSIPFNQSWIGYGLIVIGLLALLQNLPYFPFWMTFRRFLPPFVIIGLGIWILYRNTKEQQQP